MTTHIAFRKFEDSPEFQLSIWFEGGRWWLSSRNRKTGLEKKMDFAPEAMDRLVAEWPVIRKGVAEG